MNTPSPLTASPTAIDAEAHTPLLSVKRLTVSFARSPQEPMAAPVQAVTGIDFEVDEGRTLAVVGESGSGKSASLLGVAGLLPRTARVEGDVRFAGRDLLALTSVELRSVRGKDLGFVFQDPNSSLHPQKTIGAQIEETLVLHSRLHRQARRRRVVDLLDRVGIAEPQSAFSAYPYQYSGGMRQRAMIAMAIANHPRLIIADEPTTALDVTVQASIVELLSELQREDNTAIVFVNHDLAVVHQIAHRVIVMRHGSIVECGTRDDVYDRPEHPYTRELLAASTLHTNGVPAGEGAPADRDGGTQRLRIRDRADETLGSTDSPRSAEPLELRDVTKTFRRRGRRGRTRVLDGVGFHIAPGEIVALVGESGSGKSTIGKIVAGLQYADSGTVRVAGHDLPTAVSDGVPKIPRPQRRAVQMVFQDSYSSLNPRRTARDSIVAPLVSGGTKAADADEALRDVADRTGLAPRLLNRFPSQLSGGERQRVAIARALMLCPEIIVADEAISALDVTAQAEILATILRTRARSRTSFLFITHDLGVARYLADRVIVLSPEGIADVGDPAEVFAHPRTAYTRALVDAVPRIRTATS